MSVQTYRKRAPETEQTPAYDPEAVEKRMAEIANRAATEHGKRISAKYEKTLEEERAKRRPACVRAEAMLDISGAISRRKQAGTSYGCSTQHPRHLIR